MNTKSRTKKHGSTKDELLPFYDLSKVTLKPNRFAALPRAQLVVMLDPDLSKVFTTPEAVNKALRGLLDCLPVPVKTMTSERKRKSATA